jgi:uncharacterized protein (TIGR03083 family)
MIPRSWVDDATGLILQAVDSLTDEADFASPSALPGWTVGHIVAHLHFNAEAIGRLVVWARADEITPMYSDMAQRNGDIEAGSKLPPAKLRQLVHESAATLTNGFDSLTPRMWENTVVTAQGRTVPATELVWMRFREVAIHGIDLGTGITFTDFPAEAVAKLVHEIVAKRLASNEAPALAAYLTGRTQAGPPLGAWL